MAGELSWLATADGASPWSQATVLVTGLGVSGFAAADGLLEFGARVIVVEDTVTEVTADKAELLRTLGADVRLGPGSSALRPGRHRPGGHHRLEPTPPAARRGGGRRDRHLERAGARLATRPPPASGALARHHRNQRQDHHDPDAGVDAAGGRTADRGGRQHRPTGDGDGAGPRAVRRAGGRAVQPPAALVELALAALGGGVEPAARPLRVARRRCRLPRRQGEHLRARADRVRLQRRRPGHRADGRGRGRDRGCPRHRVHPGHPGVCRCWESSTTCWSTGRSSSSDATPPSSWPPSPT